MIGIGSRGALQRERQPAALGGFEHARAHPLQRIEHAPHRPLAQGGIAVEGRGHRRAGDRADRQPAAGAGIAEIERAGRLREAADADAVNSPQALGRRAPAGRRARAWPRRCAARPRLPAGRQPCSRRPSARPRIRARCEIDLSPGTRIRPCKGPPRRAVSGVESAGFTGAILNKPRRPTTRPRGASSRGVSAVTRRACAIDRGAATSQVKHRFTDHSEEPDRGES